MKVKRFFKSGGALFAAFSALTLWALVGCQSPGGNDTKPPSLDSIHAEAAKTECLLGQDLDLSAITVVGTYSDGSAKEIPITAGNISGYDKSRAGEQTVTVTAEGKTSTFTVTVVEDIATAKEALGAAVEEALNSIAEIVVSEDGSGVPAGVKWATAEQKAELDAVIEAALELAASEEADIAEIVAKLEALQAAAEALAALAEKQTGTKTEWSYTVSFDNNGGEGANPEPVTVATPETTVGGRLPAKPAWNGFNGFICSGWNTEADGTGSVFTETTPVAADITVYARWTAIVDALPPAISVQPQDAAYAVGGTAAALSVTATSPDGGVL
ncbi:MAG: bacterial Ig-like domain-containing protein, partial [Treponema sp.]|nr:bacterial Ig-like domain-containing protein [Treponema sp.]